VLGFGARDEDGRRDLEGETIELLLAGDVLDGFVGEAAEDEVVVAGLLVRGEEARGVGVEFGAGDCEGVQQQQERVAVRVGAKVGRCVEPADRSGEGFTESRRGSGQGSVLSCQLHEDYLLFGAAWMRMMLPSGSVTEIISMWVVLPWASVKLEPARWNATC